MHAMKHIAAILMFTLVCGSDLLAAEPLKIEFYDVQGTSGRELLQSLSERGPLGKDGIRYHGFTRWQVKWTYQFASKGKRCEIASLEAEPSGIMTLPRWDSPARASTTLKQEWTRYMAALRVHENGHYNLAVSAANEIKQRYSRLSSDVGCEALRAQIGSKARAVIAQSRTKETEYDASSGHGATQGARFFP